MKVLMSNSITVRTGLWLANGELDLNGKTLTINNGRGNAITRTNGYINGELMGIAHYLFHRSTWAPHRYCYLEDLFVAEAARGQGLGRALIEAVYEKARAANASRVYWLTQSSNTQARILYDRVADNLGFIQYRKVL